MIDDPDALEGLLREGQKLAGQSSRERRAPARAAIASLTKARHALVGFVDRHPEDPRGWQLLALAEETLLHYAAAVAALERAIELGAHGKRELKRLAMLREARASWASLPLAPEKLAGLASYLEQNIGDGPYPRDFRWTRKWLEANGIDDPEPVLEAFRKRGGYSDMQVYYNVARG